MIWAALALLVIGLGTLLGSSIAYSESGKKGARIAGGFLIGLAVLTSFPSMFYTIDAGEFGVEILFGDVRATTLEPGIHAKNPFTHVVTYSARPFEITYTNQMNEGDRNEPDALTVVAADQAEMEVDVTLIIRLEPSKAEELYRSGTSFAALKEVLIRPITRSVGRDCFAPHGFEESRTTERVTIAECMLVESNKGLNSRGIIIESVAIREVTTVSETIQDAINRRIEAEQHKQTAEQDRQRAETERLTAIIQAQAQADVARERAQGEADALLTVAGAQAQANNLVAASLTDAILQLRIYEALAASGNSLILLGDSSGIAPLLPLTAPSNQ